MMRTLVALVLLAATSTAASALAPIAPPIDLDLTACDYLESVNTVPGALVDPLIPDVDFSVAGTANLVVGIARCQALTADGRSDEVVFGWADVGVYPRQALRSPAGGLHLYRIEHLAMDDLYGEIHRGFAAECRMIDSAIVVAGVGVSQATGYDDGVAAWDIRALTSADTGNGGSTHYREFGPAAGGGYAYLEGDLVGPGIASLPGLFVADQESPLFTLWGPAWPSRVQAAQGFAITDTTIGFLASPNAPAPRETC
jgi:hypothetical protein